jgi:DNA integrity scanning protein DisA with diadenylate cyclase activity
MYISQKKVDLYFNITDKNRKLFWVFLKQLLFFNKTELINSQYRFLELKQNELILRKIIQFIHNIHTPHRINFEHLSSFIHNSIKYSRIDIFSILCPSYRNDGSPGIKEKIWDTTKKALCNSIILYQTLLHISKW